MSEAPPYAIPTHLVGQRLRVLAAGICSLLVTLGVARFSYTPLLPIMLEQTELAYAGGAWLTSAIYLGYLVGALMASVVKSLPLKEKLYKAGLIVAVVSTGAMAGTENLWMWTFWRFWAGLSGAAGLMLASALIMHWLLRHDLRSELGVHFAGVGLGIVVISLAVELMTWGLAENWRDQWLWLTCLGAMLVIPAWAWMPSPDPSGQTVSGMVLEDKPPSRAFLQVFFIAYMFAGVGYVVSATFTVAIVEQLPGMEGQGNLAFLVLGAAAVPACIIWDRLARQWGYMTSLSVAFALHLPAVLLPVLTAETVIVLFSTALFGFCFIGTVSMVLTVAGLYYPTHPAKMMGRLTIGYGAAQIVAPLLIGWFSTDRGGYDHGLLLAAVFMGFGTVLMLWLRSMNQEPV